MLDILSRCAVSSPHPSDSLITPGVQVPTALVEEPQGEQSTNVLMAVDLVEYAMVAEMSEVEGLEPCSLAEVKHSPDWLFWEKAIFKELKTLEEAGTWKLIDPPAGANIVGSKWVFCMKKDAAGHVVVFTGPVDWTENFTETELDTTAKDRTTGCGCPDSESFRLPVLRFDEN